MHSFIIIILSFMNNQVFDFFPVAWGWRGGGLVGKERGKINQIRMGKGDKIHFRHNYHKILLIEGFSIEYLQTETKVITPANLRQWDNPVNPQTSSKFSGTKCEKTVMWEILVLLPIG